MRVAVSGANIQQQHADTRRNTKHADVISSFILHLSRDSSFPWSLPMRKIARAHGTKSRAFVVAKTLFVRLEKYNKMWTRNAERNRLVYFVLTFVTMSH